MSSETPAVSTISIVHDALCLDMPGVPTQGTADNIAEYLEFARARILAGRLRATDHT